MQLSILDYAQIDEGKDAYQAFHHTIQLAKMAERYGYSRFWMAEHHDVPAFASSSPEMMMMHLLNQTSRIRIGSGGVMLPHYSPFKVAENFRVMETLFPGRVDLGIGSTIGTPRVNKALNEMKQKKLPFETSIQDILSYLTSKEVVNSHRMAGITANPYTKRSPSIWLLSASMRSAKIAAKLGVGYTFGLFPLAGRDNMEKGLKAVEYYRAHFEPSEFLSKPQVSIAPFLVLGETQSEAEYLAQALDFWLLGLDDFSYYKQFPSVATAQSYRYSELEKETIKLNRARMVMGDVKSVTSQLDELTEKFSADELLVIPLMPDIKYRLRAVELLGETYLIKPRPD